MKQYMITKPLFGRKKKNIYIYNKIKLRTKQGENVREMKSTTG
jgi:hypothetical protein